MFSKSLPKHDWLQTLVGTWDLTHDCLMSPDSEPSQTRGRMTGKSLGGIWVILESQGRWEEHGDWRSLITLGYDPVQRRYLGAFVSSLMTHHWVYHDIQHTSDSLVTLKVNGPTADGSGTTTYMDTVQIVNQDHWLLTSKVLCPDGSWFQFMSGTHYRIS